VGLCRFSDETVVVGDMDVAVHRGNPVELGCQELDPWDKAASWSHELSLRQRDLRVQVDTQGLADTIGTEKKM
jgi:hypothetical protein